MKFLNTVAAVFLLALSAGASADLYTFEVNPNTGGALGNNAVDGIETTYNSDSERFTWSTTLSEHSAVDGFWLVVNNGPNPKGSDVNELAIIYGDLERGILSTYVYNGRNSADSIINPATLLQTDTLSSVNDKFSFDISTSAINSWLSPDPDYTGIAFDENIGIWFHFSTGSNFIYNNAGDIVEYHYDQQGYYDVANKNATVSVSAPSLIALFGLAFAGLTLARRNVS